MTTPETITLATAIISAFAALIGVAIGSIVSIIIARQQFRASVLSGNRQTWINTLRDTIAEFQSVIFILGIHSKGLIESTDAAKNFERAAFLRAKIHLLINPKENDHENLASYIDQAISEIFSKEKEATGLYVCQTSITSLAQQILKREWERVKLGT